MILHSLSMDFNLEILVQPHEPDEAITAEDRHDGNMACAFEPPLESFINSGWLGRFDSFSRMAMEMGKQPVNQTVVGAVENILDNPALILEQAAKQRLREAHGIERRQTENADAEAELKKIQTEEDRLLAAYRTGILSPAQLGTELEALKARRNFAETRRARIPTAEPLIATQAARRSV
jgi:hypothetical protein